MSAIALARRMGFHHWLIVLVLLALGVLATATYSFWRPLITESLDAVVHRTAPASDHGSHEAQGAAVTDHGHEHSADEDPNHLDLSPQAQRNIGLKVGAVTLQEFEREITIPGIVVERPGRTSAAVAAPLGGAAIIHSRCN